MKRSLFILVAGLLCLTSAFALAAVNVLDGPGVQGQELHVQLTDSEGERLAHQEIQATYYPATELSETDTACVTNETGRCFWTPKKAGLVRLTSGAEELVVAVRYPSIPWSSVGIFALAGFVLFGGLMQSVRVMLRPRSSEEDDKSAS